MACRGPQSWNTIRAGANHIARIVNRASTMPSSIAASTRELAANDSSRIAFDVMASSSTPPSTRAVDSTASVSPTISTMPTGKSAQRFEPNPRKRWRTSGSAAALLRPRGGKEAHGEHGSEHHHGRADRRPGWRSPAVESGSRRPTSTSHGTRVRGQHRGGVLQPDASAAPRVAHEVDRGRRRAHGLWRRRRAKPGGASMRSGSDTRLSMRWRRMRSKCAGSCACTSSPGRGR
mgnify:CR=1 FL=1